MCVECSKSPRERSWRDLGWPLELRRPLPVPLGGHHLRAFTDAVLRILPHHLLVSQYLPGLDIHVTPFDLEKPKDGSKPLPDFARLVSVGTRPWSPGLPDYKACALSSWSFPTGKYRDELPCRGVKKSADGGTQTRELGVAGQDQGSALSSVLRNPLSGRPQWGEEPVSKGHAPASRLVCRSPGPPCPRGPGCPGCLWASSRDGWTGLQDVPLQGAGSAVCRRWGPGRTWLCGCPFSAREGAEGERESGVGCRLGANVRGGLREGLDASAAWLSLPGGQRGSSCVCPAVGPGGHSCCRLLDLTASLGRCFRGQGPW